jgi:integrase
MARKKRQLKRSNGEGTIRQRENGVWEYRYTEDNPVTGITERKSYSSKNEEEFQNKVLEIKSKLLKKRPTEACNILLWDWIYEWLHVYKKKRKPTTFDSYELTAQKHIKDNHIGKIPIGKLSTEDLQRFYDSKLENKDKKWAECKNKDCGFILDDSEIVDRIRLQHVESRHCPKCKGPMSINKGVGIRTVHYLRTQIIGGALKKAFATRKIDYNPNDETEIPELEYKETEPFSLEQIQEFLTLINSDKHGLAIKIDVGTGLRLGELLSLKWPEIDLDKGIISIKRTVGRVRKDKLDNENIIEVVVKGSPMALTDALRAELGMSETKTFLVYMDPKTKKSKSSIPIPPKLLPQLKLYKANQKKRIMSVKKSYKDNSLVFCGDFGTQLDPKNFREHYQYLLRKAGLPENTFHALRHTFGALLLEMGEDMKVIQELMRHDDFATTADTYVKVAEKLKQKAATKMNAIF